MVLDHASFVLPVALDGRTSDAADRLWLRGAYRFAASARLIRLGLHPADFDHAALMACWIDVLKAALAQREPVTKTQALHAFSTSVRQRV